MSMHESLMPLKRAAHQWDGLPEIGSGGFASVRALSESEVIKLSCCAASNTWMRNAVRGRSRIAWPTAFPRILESLGPQGKDSDGQLFEGWRMERLFALNEKRAAIHGRSAQISRRMSIDSSLAKRGVHFEAEALMGLEALMAAFPTRVDAHPFHDARVALVLASACQAELREGFVALYHFIRHALVKLDVSGRSNILMDCFGRLRLADPVTMVLEQPEESPPVASPWVAARVPLEQHGLKVKVHWMAVPMQSAQLAAAFARDINARSGALGAQVCNEEVAAALLAQPASMVSFFEYGPFATEALNTNFAGTLLSQSMPEG